MLPPSGTPVPPPITVPPPPPPPVPPAQVLEMVLVSMVTAAVSEMTLPHASVAPVCMATVVFAIIFHTNDVYVPICTELPTCQNTLSVEFAPSITTLAMPGPLAVVSVLPIWKTMF